MIADSKNRLGKAVGELRDLVVSTSFRLTEVPNSAFSDVCADKDGWM